MTGLINPLLVLSLIPLRLWQFWCAVAIPGLPHRHLGGHGDLIVHSPDRTLSLVRGILLILSRELYGEPFASWWQSKAASD